MAKNLLVTGAYRSGTTLLDKLLNSHSQVNVASQILQIFLFEVKGKFLESRSIERRYPIDSLFLEKEYTLDDFFQYLSGLVLTEAEVSTIFNKEKSYSGILNPDIIEYFLSKNLLRGGSFYEILHQIFISVASYFGDKPALWVGTKEVFSMEFVPFLLDNGISVIQINRDPRDQEASTLLGDAIGSPPPLLYNARMWRKHIALYSKFQSNPNFLSIKYENLTAAPHDTLGEITSFLGVEPFENDAFSGGIRDQNGKKWSGNSSHSNYSSISASSVGKFKELLPPESIRYIEAVCYPEMKLMEYEFVQRPINSRLVDMDGIHGLLMEHGKKEGFDPDYSFNSNRKAEEVERLEKLGKDLDAAEKRLWFIFPEAYEALRAAVDF